MRRLEGRSRTVSELKAVLSRIKPTVFLAVLMLGIGLFTALLLGEIEIAIMSGTGIIGLGGKIIDMDSGSPAGG